MTPRFLNLHFQINDAADRISAVERHNRRAAWATAALLAACLFTLVHMALTLARDMPQIMARAAAEQAL